uniref:Uncharacterized protein n=1 Tax=Rhizophora mucronata TaxID=61149 RepID=A0A2P2QEK9_RHIMU
MIFSFDSYRLITSNVFVVTKKNFTSGCFLYFCCI